MRRQKKSEEKNTVDELNKLLTEKHKIINKELFKKYLRNLKKILIIRCIKMKLKLKSHMA